MGSNWVIYLKLCIIIILKIIYLPQEDIKVSFLEAFLCDTRKFYLLSYKKTHK